MAFVRELTKCTAASRRPELERRNMVRSSPIGTCASTASRSPRRFRDGAAKFDFCTVNRVARCRGEVPAVLVLLVLMQVASL